MGSNPNRRLTTIDLASCLAAIPDRRRAEGKILQPSRRHPVLDPRHAEWRSVVSANSRSDPRQAFLAQRGVSGRGAASGAGLHLCARHPAAARPGRAREGVPSSCGKPRQLLRGRAVPLHRLRRKVPAAEIDAFADRDRARRTISALSRPTSSAPSVQRTARARRWFYQPATPMR